MSDYLPHQQRVVDEYNELFEKTTKLGLFFATKIFAGLDPAEQERLNRQWQIMQQYGWSLANALESLNE